MTKQERDICKILSPELLEKIMKDMTMYGIASILVNKNGIEYIEPFIEVKDLEKEIDK